MLNVNHRVNRNIDDEHDGRTDDILGYLQRQLAIVGFGAHRRYVVCE